MTCPKKEQEESPADADWALQVLRNGTMTDKLSLMTLTVQEAPAYTLDSLEKLLQMASKKARREAIKEQKKIVDDYVRTQKLQMLTQLLAFGELSSEQEMIKDALMSELFPK